MHKVIKIAGNLVDTEDIIEVREDIDFKIRGVMIKIKDGTELIAYKEDSPEFFKWINEIRDNAISLCPQCGRHDCDHKQEELINFTRLDE